MIFIAALYSLFTFFIGVIVGDMHANENRKGASKLMYLTERGVKRRKQILKFIKEFTEDFGYAPTVREIADGVFLSSASTVQGHLEILRAQKKVAWEPKAYRTIRIVNKNPLLPTEDKSLGATNTK